jgi:chromosome partitioning protein
MHTIALVNQKGGVGKSTTAVNLSAGLARLGRRVLLIDLDPQAHSTVALGLQPKKLAATIYSLLSGAATLKDVIKPVSPGLSIIPSTINLAGGEAELTWQQNPHFILKKALADLGDADFDYAIVDSPPQLGFLNVNSLAWVKHVFIPLTCEFYALHGLSLLVETVERIKAKLNPELQISGVIANQFNGRRALTKDVIADLETHFPGKVMKARIRVNVKLAEAPSHGMSIHQYAPGSNGSKDYMDLAREMLEILPAAAAPEVEAQLAAIAAAEAEAKGNGWSKASLEQVTPTWSAPEAPAAEAPAEAPTEAVTVAAEAAPAPEVSVTEPVAASSEMAEAVVADAFAAKSAPVDPLADLMAPVESAAAAEVEVTMPPPADEGRVAEPSSPMIISAEELAASMASAAVESSEPAAPAEAEAAPLGFDPYAESSAHLEAPEAEASKPEFVSPLPATPVSELRAAISSDAPTKAVPESTVKPVPALPSVKAAALPFGQRIAMAGFKPIVTSKPVGATYVPPTEKKSLFSKLNPWKR